MKEVGRTWFARVVVTLTAVVSLTRAAAGQTDDRSAAQRAGDAHVEAGDRVVLKIAREPLLGDTVTVNARGEIALAKIGTIAATSMSIRSLEDTIRARYAAFLRTPSLNLLVLRRVVVNGEVAKPNVYYVDVSTTLRDVIATAGGVTELGDESRVDVMRRGERTHLPAWREDFSVASDLRSGDEVIVGKRPWLERNALSVASTGLLLGSVLITLLRR